MNRNEISNIINGILHEKLGVEPEEIKEDESIINSLGADSLDMVEIIMECEVKFNVAISDDAAEGIKTPKDLIDLMDRKLNA